MSRKVGYGLTESRTELGKFIRARRLALGLCQTEVAEKTGISQIYMSALEVGTKPSFHPRHTARLAAMLQCDPAELDALNMSPLRLEKVRTELGRVIHSRREELGLSHAELAERVGSSISSVRDREYRSRASGLSPRTAKQLADALEVDISIFVPFVTVGKKREWEPQSEFGKFIRSRRIELGLSQQDLAKKLGVSWQYVSWIECQKYRLGDPMLGKLACALDVDFYLLKAAQPEKRSRYQSVGDPTTLGGFLKRRRLALRLSQREVAGRANTTIAMVFAIERNRHLWSRHDVIERIARVLECEIPAELIPSREGRT